jgi:hypothetical protein
MLKMYDDDAGCIPLALIRSRSESTSTSAAQRHTHHRPRMRSREGKGGIFAAAAVLVVGGDWLPELLDAALCLCTSGPIIRKALTSVECTGIHMTCLSPAHHGKCQETAALGTDIVSGIDSLPARLAQILLTHLNNFLWYWMPCHCREPGVQWQQPLKQRPHTHTCNNGYTRSAHFTRRRCALINKVQTDA